MTSAPFDELWILPEDEADFEIVFAVRADVARRGCLVSVTCRWQPVETRTFELYPDRKTDVFLQFKSGYELRGWMKLMLTDGGRAPSISVFADISYDCPGRLPMQYFEGFVFIRECDPKPGPGPGPGPGPDPDPPWIPPDSDGPPDDDDQPVIGAPSDELFPYLYLRRWPKAPDEDLDHAFIAYGGASPPASSFIADLANAVPKGRAAMERLAVDFIAGAPPYQGQFIAARAGLAEPLRGFAKVALRLDRRQDQGWREEWIHALCQEMQALLHGNHQTGADLYKNPYLADLDQVWQSYFALVIVLGYDRALLSDFALTLWVANAAAKGLALDAKGHLQVQPRLTPGQRALLAEASVLLPADVFPLPPALPAPSSPPAAAAGWVEPYAVGDLQMVRQRLLRYSAGEIARIENVMRGERREVSSRQARQQLDVQQRSGEDEQILESADADERTGLIEEAARTIAGKTVGNDYNNLTTSYGPPTNATLNGTCAKTITAGPAGSDDVTRFAREILTKTVNRISRKVGTLRASSTLSQVEDAIVSVVDNSGGGDNLRAIYRWVNKVYEACVVNYGNRLMMEFVVPLPAARFIDRAEARPGPERAAPAPPARRGIHSFASIQPDTYASLCADYGVTDIVPPPQESVFVTAALRGGEEAQVAIPAGYCASRALAGFVSTPAGLAAPAILVGCQSVGTDGTATNLPSLGESATLPVSVAGVAPSLSPPAQPDILVNVEIECTRTSRSMDEWRIGIYAGIVNAYRESLERVAAGHATGALPLNARSPLACREIERRALRDECTRLLIERAAMLTGAPFLGSPPTPAGAGAPRYRQFLDATLEWPEMSYTLLPGDPAGDGGGDGDGGDPLFVNFLNAAQARVLLPVRPERAIAFLYFFELGTIWDGADRLIAVNGPDVDAVDDLKRAARGRPSRRRIGRPWEIVVPTAMQVLDGGGGLGAAGAAL